MKKHFENKNGNMTIEEFLDKYPNTFTRDFRTNTSKCPPLELLHTECVCFYCKECFDNCNKQIKEYKKYYKVKNKKYFKKDGGNIEE